MQPNPAYNQPTSPHGFFRLADFSPITDPTSPVFVWGHMYGLPATEFWHTFAISEYNWDGADCATAGNHLNLMKKDHGFMNWGTPWSKPSGTSHTGDLVPLKPDASGFDDYYNLNALMLGGAY